MAIREVNSNFKNSFGDSRTYILFLEVAVQTKIVWVNESLLRQLRTKLTAAFLAENTREDYICLYNAPVACLEITGKEFTRGTLKKSQRNTVQNYA